MELHELALDYRIKSVQSSVLKYHRYYPDHQARKVFDDLLGFRSLCDNYDDVLALGAFDDLRIADMPIEIQYNTYYDRQFNNWLHKYIYKKNYSNSVGCHLRNLYENAKILSEQDFKEELKHVLSDC